MKNQRCVLIPYTDPPKMITPLRSDQAGRLWALCPEDKKSKLARIEPDSVCTGLTLWCRQCEKWVEINLPNEGGAIDKITNPDVN